ncbi:CD3324 family protein [uncultured Clostridium sp.]|uniref:CD3324 family protein n=1 Tax=uncultured Clostridium sp. TaxID=59620 RepID=UPI00262CF342|nr:CD3324 family protein [uncultured Clostridium sp.]
MKYIKATDVLPKEIIEILQEYIDGECVYIPRKVENQKSWGENSGIKTELKIRNIEIYKDYLNGFNISDLSQKYFLSDKSIRRIINEEKQMCS